MRFSLLSVTCFCVLVDDHLWALCMSMCGLRWTGLSFDLSLAVDDVPRGQLGEQFLGQSGRRTSSGSAASGCTSASGASRKGKAGGGGGGSGGGKASRFTCALALIEAIMLAFPLIMLVQLASADEVLWLLLQLFEHPR